MQKTLTTAQFKNRLPFETRTPARRGLLFRVLMGLLALWLGCFFGLGAAGIFDLDEGLYSTVARQMVESGNWIVPRVGTQTFYDKPPLFYWCEALGIRVFGESAFAVRLPSAIAAALTALVLWWWCKKQGKERMGWLAAALYVFCPLTFVLAREAVLDSLLTLWLTLAVVAFIEAYRSEGRTKGRAYLALSIAAGLAVMTKGVIGVLLPATMLLFWLWLRRDKTEARRVPWLLMALVVGLIIAPWHLLMWRATGQEFVREYIVHNHVQRFLGKDFAHNAPFWSYAPVLLVGLFPWSVGVPLSWWQGWKARHADGSSLDSALGIWALWAAVVVIFFSISKSKLPSYVLPAVPALCLLIAVRLEALWTKGTGLVRLEAFAVGVVGLLLGGILTFVGVVGWTWRGQSGAMMWAGKPLSPNLVEPIALLSPVMLGLGMILLLGCGWMLLRWKTPFQVVVAGLLMNAGIIAVLAGVGLPIWNAADIAPLHDMARKAIPALEKGDHLVLYRFKPSRPSVRFVVGHAAQVAETGDAAQLQRDLEGTHGGLILTATTQPLPALPFRVHIQAANAAWTLWRCEPVSHPSL